MLRNKGAPGSMMGSKHSIAEEVTGENVNEPPSEGVEGGWRLNHTSVSLVIPLYVVSMDAMG